MAIEQAVVGQSQKNLKSGRQWYAYSGAVQGGPSNPALVTLLNLRNTGLRDSFVKIRPFFGPEIANAYGDALGIEVLLDGVVVIRQQSADPDIGIISQHPAYELFIPKRSTLLIESRNTAPNTLQDRGVTVLGWYL